MSKYDPLCDYLLECKTDKVTLTFSEIEKIIGSSLPPSAYKYREWWANDASHTQAANGWLVAGCQTLEASLGFKIVQFNRVGRPKT